MTNVHVAKFSSEMKATRPVGFCCDIGAPKSCIGRKELNRIFTAMGSRVKTLSPSTDRFRFADATYESLGKVMIPLLTPPGIPAVNVELDVVQADIPALLGMDVFDRESITPCTVSNRLVKRVPVKTKEEKTIFVDEWSVPLRRAASGHLYAEMQFPASMFFTRSQLSRIHRQFFHPSAQKLFNLLRKARPEDTTPETLKVLEDLTKRCDPCQRIQKAPVRFRVSFGAENVRFNERLFIDIFYIDGEPVLHILDEGTKFGAARFLPDVSTKTIWKTIVECWAAIYTGLPNRMLVDQGSAFGELFINIAAASNVSVERTGIEAHSSLGLGERYHQPLRNTVRKMRIDQPQSEKNLVLALAVKAMNDTLGPEGLVPSALVFVEFPPVYSNSEVREPRATLESRAALASSVRREMETQMAELRLKRALHHAVPPAADRAYEAGDKVLIWRENLIANRIGEWIGPFEVVGADDEKKLIYVRDCEIGAARPFNAAQVKPYFPPENIAQSFIMELHIGFERFMTPTDDEETFMIEILDPSDPRAKGKEMSKAKKEEIRNLLRRGTFKIILREEIPPDGNVLPGRFILSIKSTADDKTKFKARYVIGGHRDRFKDMMVHSSATLQPQSIRLFLALARIFGFDIWTSDVRQAYLQSAVPLSRDVFIDKPVPEFELRADQCLQLLRPLYGLCESGNLWFETMDKHHRGDLRMKPFRIDPALYYHLTDGFLSGLSGGYVDDLIRAGNKSFRKLSRKTNEKFEMDEDIELPCKFTGFKLSYDEEGNVIMDQHAYLRKLEEIPLDATFSQFRSMRMKLAWLSNSRPDCLFEISQLAQVTEDIFNSSKRETILRLNKAIKFAVNSHTALKISKLDKRSLRVIGFSDSSFANNADLSSQLGHIVFIGDNTDKVVPISFKSYKSRRVTRSAMAGEVIAFSDMFDISVSLSKEMETVMGRTIPVQLLTDSKSLFDVVSKGSRTSEKRTMLDIAAAREGFRRQEISDIGFVRSSRNVADGLTKSMSQAFLQKVLSNGTLNVHPEQWIVRSKERGVT